jgi:putative ABC transport system permease protein
MAASVPRVFCWIGLSATFLFVSASVRNVAAAEIVIESVKPAESPATPVRFGVTREDLRRISSTLPGVQHVMPVREIPARAVHGEREQQLRLVGTTPEYAQLNKRKLEQGRFLLAKDLRNRNNIAVVDSLTARRLFPGGQAIGKNIRLSKHYFLIVGVLAVDSESSSRTDETSGSYRVIIPLTTMQSRYGDMVLQTQSGTFQVQRYELSRVHVVTENAADLNQTAAVIESLLNKYHDKEDYAIRVVGPTGRN